MTVSMGDNLFAHIPITSISEEITAMVEKYAQNEEASSDEEINYNDEDEDTEIVTATMKTSDVEFPNLQDIFQVGQWINAQIVESDKSKKEKD